jgi:phosphoribosylformimino-5-aminoimidazole carboxamide ribotide isomerase
MTKFRPCIDLHSGQVKQIVGGTLTTQSSDLKTNYVSKLPAGHFAKLYKDNGLEGAHVIMLGPGNEEAAREAVSEWPAGLQVGGGITDVNAQQWIDWGAERVCYKQVIREHAMLIRGSRLLSPHSYFPTESSRKKDWTPC